MLARQERGRRENRSDRDAHLLRVDGERPFTVARAAEADSDLARGVLEEGSEDLSALATVELDVFELREDARPAGDDSADAHEGIEVRLAQVTEGVGGRQLGDADVDLGVNASVVREREEDDLERDLVEDREHCRRRVGEEVGEDGLRVGQMQEGNLERFGVNCLRHDRISDLVHSCREARTHVDRAE